MSTSAMKQTEDRQHRVRMLVLTSVLHAFTHLYQVALMPLYLLIQQDLRLTGAAQATLLLTVLLVACFGLGCPMGVLAHKFNRKRLLAVGLAITSLAFIGLAFVPSYGWALVAVAIAGFGGSF